MIITDAYAHCGLRKYKPVADLDACMDGHGVSRTVLAEHLGEYDNSYIESVVKARPKRFAGVFLVDLANPKAADEVRRWKETGAFRGIRFPSESLLTHPALWQWAAQLGLHFVVSAPFPKPVTEALSTFASHNRRTQIQLTHLGTPALAERRNVHVQISGMHKLGKPPYTELIPQIQELHRRYGAERLLYASNFPVMETWEAYATEIDLLRTGRLGIPEKDVPLVMNANAERMWFAR